MQWGSHRNVSKWAVDGPKMKLDESLRHQAAHASIDPGVDRDNHGVS
jgi:hypothetical protein